MQAIRSLLVTAAAAVLVGAMGSAEAANNKLHTMTIQLPGGGTARIQYVGDVAPKVTLVPGWQTADVFVPDPAFFGWSPLFASLNSAASEMDRQLAAAQQQMEQMQAQLAGASDQPIEAALKNAPPGSESFSVVTVSNGKGFCMQSVHMVKPVDGKPQVQRQSSGDCSGLRPSNENQAEALWQDDGNDLTSIGDHDGHSQALLHEATAVQSN